MTFPPLAVAKDQEKPVLKPAISNLAVLSPADILIIKGKKICVIEYLILILHIHKDIDLHQLILRISFTVVYVEWIC